MKYNKNEKLKQITDETLIVGVDVSKDFHVARAQDFRGIELGESITFDNDYMGIYSFLRWASDLKVKFDKSTLIIGMEPTGPYWFNLARVLRSIDLKVVTVNPHHVKKSKELDDNNQTKTDYKDAKVIAQLVKDARFASPNILDGIYEDLRNYKKVKELIIKDLVASKNQVHNWLVRFFPEYHKVFKNWESQSFMHILRTYVYPCVVANYSPEELYEELPKKIRKSAGRNKIIRLVSVCKTSIGSLEGHKSAAFELRNLLNKYEIAKQELEMVSEEMKELCSDMEETEIIGEIKGLTVKTACDIVSELGDIKKYTHPDQLIKMAGLSLMENSSGKKKGQTTISKRGRSGLRKALYLAVFSLIRHNKGFKELHKYYTTRAQNQLKGKQSMMALARKLLRIIFACVTKGVAYDGQKMLGDIHHSEEFLAIA